MLEFVESIGNDAPRVVHNEGNRVDRNERIGRDNKRNMGEL